MRMLSDIDIVDGAMAVGSIASMGKILKGLYHGLYYGPAGSCLETVRGGTVVLLYLIALNMLYHAFEEAREENNYKRLITSLVPPTVVAGLGYVASRV